MSQTPLTGKLKRLNRRQRKKLLVGEFQELVFDVQLSFNPPLDESAYADLLDGFIALTESRHLVIGGFGGSLPLLETDGLVSKWGPGSASEADRQAVQEWLEKRPEVSQVQLGELVDGWYGTDQAR
ncbi:DUF469 family protein [Pigmentiphaga aceris]|uniref:DUF469 family protein n=1 Tax=Pigmentiphaga aceris TaxID=1940612 RepID=A0A5C0B1Z2_9BURK|nr:YggL family protein [Pigmentiphaga aceris]QEI07976.1 DUF469 family protein [Pigmentiphaga aceris]